MGRVVANVVATLAVGMLALATNVGHAQTARSGGGGNAQLLQQLQQLASERTSLQAENAKLKKDLADMQKDRDALKAAQQVVDRRAKSSELALKENLSQRASGEQELAQTKEKMQQLIGKFRETLQTLRDVETENTTTKQTVATRDQQLKVCIDRNLELYKLNQEVLTRLEHQTVWARVAEAEPFTKIKRVQLENMVDDYKGRADAQRIDDPSKLKSPANARPPQGPPSSPPIASGSQQAPASGASQPAASGSPPAPASTMPQPAAQEPIPPAGPGSPPPAASGSGSTPPPTSGTTPQRPSGSP
jgi:hypothetical protein